MLALPLLVGALLLAGCVQDVPSEPAVPDPNQVRADAGDVAHLYRSATCECCKGHAAYLADAGVEVVDHVVDDINEVKDSLGVPVDMRSCHTTVIGGYAVEGHVPADAIRSLIADGSPIDGIALPGMPAGSPGMPGELEGPLDLRWFLDGTDAGPAR